MRGSGHSRRRALTGTGTTAWCYAKESFHPRQGRSCAHLFWPASRQQASHFGAQPRRRPWARDIHSAFRATNFLASAIALIRAISSVRPRPRVDFCRASRTPISIRKPVRARRGAVGRFIASTIDASRPDRAGGFYGYHCESGVCTDVSTECARVLAGVRPEFLHRMQLRLDRAVPDDGQRTARAMHRESVFCWTQCARLAPRPQSAARVLNVASLESAR